MKTFTEKNNLISIKMWSQHARNILTDRQRVSFYSIRCIKTNIKYKRAKSSVLLGLLVE